MKNTSFRFSFFRRLCERTRRLLLFQIGMLIFLGCAAIPVENSISTLKGRRVVVSDVVFMYEVFGITDQVEKYNQNAFIGAIQFSGGFVKNPDLGMMVQSASIKLVETGKFEENVNSFVKNALETAFSKRNILFENEKKNDCVLKLVVFSNIKDRNRYPEDGKDNICLPRLIRNPISLNGECASQLKKKFEDAYVVIPYVEYYYGHNGGWFNGQTFGCGAGARFSFKLIIVDLSNSSIAFKYEKVCNTLYEFKFAMSIFEMEQELYKQEKIIRNEIVQCLPR